MLTTIDEHAREQLIAAANGVRRTATAAVPQGIRVTVGPGATAAPAPVVPAPRRPNPAAPAVVPVDAPEPVSVPEPVSMPDPVGVDLVELLAQAGRSSRPAIRDLVARIEVLAMELRQALLSEAAASVARARVGQLRAELAAAEAELAAAESDPTVPAPAPGEPVAPATAVEPVDSQAVRAWAAEHGHECKSTGRLSPRLVDAYRQTMTTGSAVAA